MASGAFVLSLDDLPGPACLLVAPEGRVAHHNASFGAWAGRADAEGVTLGDLFPGDPVVAGLWDEARATSGVEHHVERRGPLGEASFWSVRARRVEAGVLVSACDLSAFADAARAVHTNQRAFVAMAAHELRAPLSAIKAWASALAPRRGARAGEEPPRDDGLAAIARQVDGMNELLSDLLEAAREGPGALRAIRSAVTVGALLDRALVGSPAASRVAIAELPEDRALVDARGIEIAMARLIDGAARRAALSTNGPIAIGAARAGAEVHVMVADTGPPISPAVEADLFARASRGGRRLGLGLHVVRLFAAASGGRAWRESDGDGARFVLALPAADAAPRARRQRRPSRVLVASRDERAAAVLRLEGHDVVMAPAPRAADELPADVVLLDPRGADVIDVIAELHDRPDPPVILILAPPGPRPRTLLGAERAGALAVLADPIDWAELVALVQIAATARGL